MWSEAFKTWEPSMEKEREGEIEREKKNMNVTGILQGFSILF